MELWARQGGRQPDKTAQEIDDYRGLEGEVNKAEETVRRGQHVKKAQERLQTAPYGFRYVGPTAHGGQVIEADDQAGAKHKGLNGMLVG